MSEQDHLSALRRSARVRVGPDELSIWLASQTAFLVVSGLVLLGSAVVEAVLIAYALERSGPGAWSIVVIVTLWVAAVLLMVIKRHRAIRQRPSLRLSRTQLLLPDKALSLSDVESVRLVERHTYSFVEVLAQGTSHGIMLGRADQGQPLIALLEGRRSGTTALTPLYEAEHH